MQHQYQVYTQINQNNHKKNKSEIMKMPQGFNEKIKLLEEESRIFGDGSKNRGIVLGDHNMRFDVDANITPITGKYMSKQGIAEPYIGDDQSQN